MKKTKTLARKRKDRKVAAEVSSSSGQNAPAERAVFLDLTRSSDAKDSESKFSIGESATSETDFFEQKQNKPRTVKLPDSVVKELQHSEKETKVLSHTEYEGQEKCSLRSREEFGSKDGVEVLPLNSAEGNKKENVENLKESKFLNPVCEKDANETDDFRNTPSRLTWRYDKANKAVKRKRKEKKDEADKEAAPKRQKGASSEQHQAEVRLTRSAETSAGNVI